MIENTDEAFWLLVVVTFGLVDLAALYAAISLFID